ncbi:MAG: hypothetical protein ACRDZ2_07740 [Ilumatobacteraceae bacterium]
MTRPCAFALGLTLGALVSPAAQILAARYSGQHVLSIEIKETPCPPSA